jgi:hypothetical protein
MPLPDMPMIATECVRLVLSDHGRTLDWSLSSLDVLDEVCSRLIADGPLNDDRLGLWRKLIGAYTGEVVIRGYGGQWVEQDGAFAVSVGGITAFPFATTSRILKGEPFKSLGSFGRALPAVIERSKR